MQISEYLQKNTHVFFANQTYEIFDQPISQIEQKIDKELTQNQDDVRLLLIKLQILYKYYHQNKEALQICKKVLTIDSQNIDVRLEIVSLLLQIHRKREEQCQALINECIQIDSSYWRIYYMQCVLFIHLDKMAEVKAYLNKHAYKFPNNIWIEIMRIQISSNQENQQNLVAPYLEKMNQCNLLDYELLQRVAYILMSYNLNSEAEQVYQKTLQLNPSNAKSLNNIGYIKRFIDKNYSECIQYCQEVLKQNPNYEDAYFNIAHSLRSQAKYKECIENLKKSINSNPTYLIAYKSMVITTYYYAKDNKLSAYYANKFIQLFPQAKFGQYMYSLAFVEELNDHEYKELNQFTLINSLKTNKEKDIYNYQKQSQILNTVYQQN